MSQPIRNHNNEIMDGSWNIRDYDPVTDELMAIDFYDGHDIFDVKVAENDGEILGYVAYGGEDGVGKIDLVEVKPSFGGLGVSRDLVDSALEILEDDYSAVVRQAKALEGPIQHMAETRGYDISGFRPERAADPKEGPHDSKQNDHGGGGLNAEMWKLDDDLAPFEVDAYLSEEVSEPVEAALGDQMVVNHLEPGNPGTGELSYDNNRGGHEARRAKVVDGVNSPEEIVAASNYLESLYNDDPWTYSVELDVTDPVSYGVSKGLAENGWSLVNIAPDLSGSEDSATAIMMNPQKEVGPYNLTSRSLGFLEATGLPFEVEEEGDKSDRVMVNPDDVLNVNTADSTEVDEVYRMAKSD